jgi:hypothetical protein
MPVSRFGKIGRSGPGDERRIAAGWVADAVMGASLKSISQFAKDVWFVKDAWFVKDVQQEACRPLQFPHHDSQRR